LEPDDEEENKSEEDYYDDEDGEVEAQSSAKTGTEDGEFKTRQIKVVNMKVTDTFMQMDQ